MKRVREKMEERGMTKSGENEESKNKGSEKESFGLGFTTTVFD